MITVWGRPTSVNVQCVMWALGELGLAHQRIDAGGEHGRTDTPAFRAMNPNGWIPVLEEDGLALFESAAIVRYLAAQHGDAGFWPADPRRRAALDVWAEWAKATLYPAFQTKVFYPLWRQAPERRDTALLAAGVAETGRALQVADARIGEGPWLGGPDFSFADIMLGKMLYRIFTLDFEKPDVAALWAYYQRLTERPAYRQHVMVSYDALRSTI